MALSFTGNYEFSYTTPSTSVDANGNSITTQIPTTFVLTGISDDVARGLARGLRRVTSITNVVVGRVMQDREVIAPDLVP